MISQQLPICRRDLSRLEILSQRSLREGSLVRTLARTLVRTSQVFSNTKLPKLPQASHVAA